MRDIMNNIYVIGTILLVIVLLTMWAVIYQSGKQLAAETQRQKDEDDLTSRCETHFLLQMVNVNAVKAKNFVLSDKFDIKDGIWYAKDFRAIPNGMYIEDDVVYAEGFIVPKEFGTRECRRLKAESLKKEGSIIKTK